MRRIQPVVYSVLVLLTIALLFRLPQPVNSQTSPDISSLAFRAFTGLEQIYHSGGTAPTLLSRLNVALGLIQNSTIEQNEGNSSASRTLASQAEAILTDIVNQTPSARSNAERESSWKTLLIVISIPTVVTISTLLFLSLLLGWTRMIRLGYSG